MTLIAVAAVSACMTLVWVRQASRTIPPVPLTAGLPRELATRPSVFDERAKARFPIGMPMTEVGAELAQEKFSRLDWSSGRNGEHDARRYDGGAPICDLEAWVFWKSDETDRLTEIKGDYQAICL